MIKTPIGNGYTPPPSMFSRRTGFGEFQHTLPPMSPDMERLQEALLQRVSKPSKGCVRRVAAVAVGVVVAVSAVFLV